jgi:BASS family bile acid:Na+ symporter
MAAAIITPFSFYLWSLFLQSPPDLESTLSVDFGKMITIIVQLIVVPISIGMLVNRYLPKWKTLMIKPVKWFSLLLLIGIIIFALTGNVKQIKSYLSVVFFLVMIHNGLALVIGYQYARWWKLSKTDAKAISIETGIQNGGLGLILIFNYFEGLGGMTLVAAWWGVWHLISGFLLSSYWALSFTHPLSLLFLKRK